MAKNLLLITFGLLLGLSLSLSELARPNRSVQSDFRGVRWGMTPQEVKQAEDSMKPSEETNSMLSYQDVTTSLYGTPYATTLDYYFVDSGLAAGCYGLNSMKLRIPNSELAATHDALAARLTDALGPTSAERRNVVNTTKGREDYDFLSVWSAGVTSVTLRLETDDATSLVQVQG